MNSLKEVLQNHLPSTPCFSKIPFKQMSGVFPINSDGLDATFRARLDSLVLTAVALGVIDLCNNDNDLSNILILSHSLVV